jgi:hypothetical protein
MDEKIDPKDIDCGYDGTDFEDVFYSSIEKQNDLEVLFVIKGREVWIPKSCIFGVDVERVFVTSVFAKKEELF